MSDPTGRGARWVYHYTGTAALRQIIASGVIRAHPTRLYRDLAMTRVARDTEPLVWLSSNPAMEMTTAIKLGLDGHALVGSVCRVALPYGYAGDLGLGEYTERAGIPYDDWQWSIRTAQMVGSHYTTWRVVTRDIPRRDWDHAEWLAGVTDAGFTWERWPLPVESHEHEGAR